MDTDRRLAIQRNLINSLKNGDEKARRYAIEELEEMFAADGTLSEAAVPVLINTLLDFNSDIRSKAEQILQVFMPGWPNSEEAKSAIPSIIEKLASSIKDTSTGAFRLLRKFGGQALPDLTESLEQSNNDRAVQLKLVQLITQMEGPITEAIPVLTNLLKGNHAMLKEAAIKALIKSKSKEHLIFEGLLLCLSEDAVEVRVAALKGLMNFDHFNSENCHAVAKCLLDTNYDVRIVARDLLVHIGEIAVPKVVELVQQRTILRKQELLRLQEAKGNLFKGVDIEKFILEPHKAAHNVGWHFQDMLKELHRVEHGILLGLEVLAQIDQDAIDTVDVLAGALKDVNPAIKEKTVEALGLMGAKAEPVLSELYSIYNDPDFTDYEGLVKSLNQIQPDWGEQEAAQPFLHFLLKRLEDNQQKINVLLALKAIPPAVLKQLTSGQNTPTVFKKEVVELILMLGDGAKDALPYLNEMIKQEELNLQESASDRKRIGFNRG